MPYLPYHEPRIATILSLTSFIVLLNVVRYILDRILYCGIIGEILIGIIWGAPVGGVSWLSNGTQVAIQEYGYLGLIGLVFEGGISTDLVLLKKAAYMSISVATIGLLMPIALSFFFAGLAVLYKRGEFVSKSACGVLRWCFIMFYLFGDYLCYPVIGWYAADACRRHSCWGCYDGRCGWTSDG